MGTRGHRGVSGQAGAFMLLGLTLLAVTGCGQRLTDSNLDQVVPDMSRKEVESILGQPTEIKTHELTLQTQMKTLSATRYYYDQNGQKVELIFVADKLVGKNGHFDADAALATRVAEKANSDQPIPGVDPDQLSMSRPAVEPTADLPVVNEPADPSLPVVEPPLPESASTPTASPAPEETF